MRSPRSRGAGLGALCVLAVACTDGEGSPLVVPDTGFEWIDGSVEDAQVAMPPVTPLDAAMPTTQPKDSGTGMPKPPTQSVCDELEKGWSHEADHDAEALLQILDAIRADAARACGWQAQPMLRRSSKLECSARLRVNDRQSVPRGDFTPTVERVGGRSRDLNERLNEADFEDAEIVFELLISNTNNLQSFLEYMPNYITKLCENAVFSPVQLAGAARRDQFWVVDFGVPLAPGSGGPRGP